MNEGQIKHMVNRFLGWRLPENFNPDAGISVKKTFNDHLLTPTKHNPSGTNLLDATQATEMVLYMTEGLPMSLEETGWLIEWPATPDSAPRWWHPGRGWTIHAARAARFCRKEDAEAFIKTTCFGTGIIATEHVWPTPTGGSRG
jgi:hypothetical protein